MTAWRELTLADLVAEAGGDIQTGPFGSQLHAADYVLDGTPSVMPQNIGDNRIDPAGIARVSRSDMERLGRYWLMAGDIVYSRRGDVERRALVRPENDGWLCGTGCLRVRIANHHVHDPAYVSYALGDPDTRAWITRHAVGATMLNLNTSILGAVPLRVPAIGEQRAIAEVLGALDDKIAANDRLNSTSHDLLEAEFRLLAQAAATSVPLSDVALLEYGKALPAVRRRPGRVPVYGSGGIGGHHDEALRKGPGVIVGRKGTVGSVYWSQSDYFAIDTTYFVSTLRGGPGLPYLYFALRTMGLDERNSDSAVPGLNRDAAYRIGVPLAATAARDEFEATVTSAFRLREAKQQESRLLTELRDTMLPALMSGRLSVKAAEAAVEASTAPSTQPSTEASQR
ncbi:restriction endonuclease subunit S [Pseudactinotalea terrae]|uniref:restriction endonuclease subunit S n=1 Tax=Pseudactinotalea terrae TaxID=1743262 RepID=UPI0019D59A4A|nr:restriction endonuclease subunit S [Pseudactinotalea terrae]